MVLILGFEMSLHSLFLYSLFAAVGSAGLVVVVPVSTVLCGVFATSGFYEFDLVVCRYLQSCCCLGWRRLTSRLLCRCLAASGSAILWRGLRTFVQLLDLP